MTAKVTAVTHSSRDMGPISRSCWRAASGAPGVSVTPGGNTQKISRGSTAMTASAGTEATSSHLPKSTFSPCSAASETPIGFADVAVSHSAEEMARLAMPQNIR
ncbi:MAG: hypothetical protein HGA21_08330 [Burkholderiaceae bacterium]|nr:hypothetical protein [Burkholderiaceae bacterium]